MKILAIDTSSQNASVSILENETVLLELNNNDEKTHSQKLMPMIDEIFTKTNLTLNDISLIACCVGPGSFTGLRIGIATAKAFADSKNIPVVAINSLESLAYNLYTEGIICSCIDAKNGNIYIGLFNLQKDDTSLMITNQNLTFLSLKNNENTLCIENLTNFLENNIIDIENKSIYFVGDAVSNYHDLIATLTLKNNNKIYFSEDYQNIASSISVAKIGYNNYKKGNFGNSDILTPVYLRKSQAEIALEQKNQ